MQVRQFDDFALTVLNCGLKFIPTPVARSECVGGQQSGMQLMHLLVMYTYAFIFQVFSGSIMTLIPVSISANLSLNRMPPLY